MEHVRPDYLDRPEREDHEHRQPEERSAPDRCESDDQASEGADRDSCDTVASTQDEGLIRDDLLAHERLRAQADRAEEECATDHLRLYGGYPVAILVLEPGRDGNADQRHRRAAEEHPAAQPGLDVPE